MSEGTSCLHTMHGFDGCDQQCFSVVGPRISRVPNTFLQELQLLRTLDSPTTTGGILAHLARLLGDFSSQ